MTSQCVRAAELLRADGISAEVVHLASIKPIDADLIVRSATRTGCAVTAENASILGGFGSAVSRSSRNDIRCRWSASGCVTGGWTAVASTTCSRITACNQRTSSPPHGAR